MRAAHVTTAGHHSRQLVYKPLKETLLHHSSATSRNELLAMGAAPTPPYLHPALLDLLKDPGELCGVEGGA